MVVSTLRRHCIRPYPHVHGYFGKLERLLLLSLTSNCALCLCCLQEAIFCNSEVAKILLLLTLQSGSYICLHTHTATLPLCGGGAVDIIATFSTHSPTTCIPPPAPLQVLDVTQSDHELVGQL